MNSLSHYAHGAVGGFIFGNVGGIRPETPGYRRIIIQPLIRPGLSWARTSYDSIQGRIATAWKAGDGKLELEVAIPMNAAATVVVPAADGSEVMEGGRPAGRAAAVRLLRSEKDRRVFEVGSGNYHFASVLPSPKSLPEADAAVWPARETTGRSGRREREQARSLIHARGLAVMPR